MSPVNDIFLLIYEFLQKSVSVAYSSQKPNPLDLPAPKGRGIEGVRFGSMKRWFCLYSSMSTFTDTFIFAFCGPA